MFGVKSFEQTIDKQSDLMKQVAKELTVKVSQAQSVIDLTNEGNTIPFIARYRKRKNRLNVDEVVISRYTRTLELLVKS